MKRLTGKAISWALYTMAGWIYAPNPTYAMYTPFRKLMLWSLDAQEWGGDGPWQTPNTVREAVREDT